MPDTALYIHIPFCETKCGYCDFYSVPLGDGKTAPLVRAIERELVARVSGADQPVRTIFIGGGTPTILPIDQLEHLLQAVGEATRDHQVAEFTVEANPGTVDHAKADLLRSCGVTRVSMGAQSFFVSELEALERIHSPDDIPPAVAALREGGIEQVNIDLIFGIPGQTPATWSESLARTVDLGVDHVSCYGLMYEPGTRLTAQRDRGRVVPCEEDLEARMFLATIDQLEGAGFHRYEISNFARPGCECLHNLMYWRNEPYIGVGPSAAGCLCDRRYKNVPDVAAYIRMINEHGQAEAESEVLDQGTLMLEMIMMQLRTREGLSIADFTRRGGVDPRDLLSDPLDRLVEADHLSVGDTHIALTQSGLLVADRVITELACAANPQDRSLPVLNG